MGFLVQKYDKLWIGLTLGFLIPLVFLAIMFFQEKDFAELLFTSLLRIGLIFNLALFLFVFNTGYNNVPKGILMATIFYGLIIVYKFIFG